jgi:hypothetical protein
MQSINPDTTDFSNVTAVLICSAQVRADIWFAFNHSFIAQDGLATYYSSELPFLATKSIFQMSGIQKTKLVFRGSVIMS